MADNHFDLVIVWDNLGGAVRVNAGGKATVTDPATGALVPVVQDGQSVTTVTADRNGRVSFVAQQGTVKLTSGGLSMFAVSAEQATAGAANAAAAQAAQAATEAARDDVVNGLAAKLDAAALDSSTAALVGGTGETGNALRAAFAGSAHAANRLVIFGDSITQQNQGITQYSATGYYVWGNFFLNGAFDLLNNAGVGGNTTAQMLARIQTDVIDHAPTWCVVFGGANDITQGVPAATTTANLASIYDQLRAGGIEVIACTAYRTATMDTAAEASALATVNEWIKAQAATRGFPLVDFYTAMTDSATGYTQTGLVADGTHPSTEGALRMGVAFAEALYGVLPRRQFFGTSNTDAANLIGGGGMAGDVAGLATSWSLANLAGTPTYTRYKQARTDVAGSQWQVLEFGPNSSGELSFYCRGPAATVAQGDTVSGFYEIETEALEAVADGMYIDGRIIVEDAANGGIGTSCAALPSVPYPAIAPGRGVLRAGALAGPGADHVLAQIRIRGVKSGIVRIGRVLLRKAV